MMNFTNRQNLKNLVFLNMAKELSKLSTCIDKQVGCILVDIDYKIIGSGYNGSAKGIEHCSDRNYCQKDCYDLPCLSAHAEQNALTLCKNPENIWICYTTLSPCSICINMLLNTSCVKIVFIKEHRHPEPKNLWNENRSEGWISYEHYFKRVV